MNVLLILYYNSTMTFNLSALFSNLNINNQNQNNHQDHQNQNDDRKCPSAPKKEKKFASRDVDKKSSNNDGVKRNLFVDLSGCGY